jgi:hypothetical protein
MPIKFSEERANFHRGRTAKINTAGPETLILIRHETKIGALSGNCFECWLETCLFVKCKLSLIFLFSRTVSEKDVRRDGILEWSVITCSMECDELK